MRGWLFTSRVSTSRAEASYSLDSLRGVYFSSIRIILTL
jgi:hypothetical protein